MEVSKSDWKLFRARIGDWQEAYMERLVKEYLDLLDGAEGIMCIRIVGDICEYRSV